MAEEVCSTFVKNVLTSLEQKNIHQALSLFKDNKYNVDIRTNCWDLISIVSKFLTFQYDASDKKLFKCCCELLDIIVDIANPEEVLLQFIEEIEETTDDCKFLTLLKPLQKSLLQLPKLRLNSLAWCFNSIHLYLNKIDADDNYDEECLPANNCDTTQRIINLYTELLPFYETFVQETKTLSETANEQKALVCKFLVQLLGKPLIFLEMKIIDGVKGKARLITEDIVQKIFLTISDPFLLLHTHFEPECNHLVNPDLLGLAVLFYLVFSEEVCIEKCPKVYNPVYFFHNSLFLATSLIELENDHCRDKGLKLAEALLRHVAFVKLSYMLLDSEYHCNFCKSLSNLIVYDRQENTRKFALSIYKIYLNAFDIKGFYLLVNNLLITLSHSGFISFTITQFKNKLAAEFSGNEENMSIYFKGPKLLKLLRQFCYLHRNEETDLIEISDQIIATLNTLRYLVLRDKHNITQIWDYLGLLEDIYFKPLRKSIELSRAHYELKLKDFEHSSSKTQLASDISVMVGRENLTEITNSEKIKVLQSSLVTIDIIDSLLSRVIECVELNKR